MLRIGLFGLGRWGTNILNTLKRIRGVEVVAFDPTRAVGETPGVFPLTPGVNEAAQFDGVIIATPGSTHAEVALPFIKAGIPTYIEKPLTISLADARKLEQAAKKGKGIVFAGHIHIYNPAYRVAKKLVAKAGKLRYLYFEGTNNGPFRDDMSAMWDWASHDVYLAIDLMGGVLPTHVQAWGIKTLRPDSSLYDFSVINMTFPGGLTTISTTSWLLPVKQKKVTIIGERDSIIFDEAQAQKVTLYKGMGPAFAQAPAGKPISVLKQEPTISYPKYSAMSPLKAELEAFIHCIKTRQQPVTGLEQGVSVVRVLAAAEKSLSLGGKNITVLT